MQLWLQKKPLSRLQSYLLSSCLIDGDPNQVASFIKAHRVTIAGTRWMRYLKRKFRAKCPKCGFRLNVKEHFLSDFYIVGFALARCNAILTRDRGIYRKYFPELQHYEPG